MGHKCHEPLKLNLFEKMIACNMVFVCIWLIVNFFFMVEGILDRKQYRQMLITTPGFMVGYEPNPCRMRKDRLDKLLPGYYFGCWLGEVPK